MLFEYEVLMNELDSFNKGLIAYENCQVVTNYYQKYKYTEHLGMLIGDEGLVSSIIEAGAKFIEWLKAKITAIIKAIKNFLIKLINKLLVFFGFKPIGQSGTVADVHASWSTISKEFRDVNFMDSSIIILIPYDIGKMQSILEDQNVLRHVFKNCMPKLGDEDSITTCLSQLESVVESIVDATKRFDNPVVKGPIGVFRGILSELFLSTDAIIEHMVRASTQLEQFKNKVTDNMSIMEIVAVADSLKYMLAYRCATDLDPKIAICDLMRLLSAYIKANLSVATHSLTALRDICRFFPIGPNKVHAEVPIDSDFKRRLEGAFGGKLNLNKLIITNLDAKSWILDIDDGKGSCGWCSCGEGLSGVRYIYLNYNFILNYIKQCNGQLTKVATRVIKTIVHESRHAFDAQTGRRFDDFNVKYENRQQEKRAFHAEEAFTVTDHDIRWIEGILKKIESGAYS